MVCVQILSDKIRKEYKGKEEGLENPRKDYSLDSDGLEGYLSKDDFSGD